jgi:hypothetical protein
LIFGAIAEPFTPLSPTLSDMQKDARRPANQLLNDYKTRSKRALRLVVKTAPATHAYARSWDRLEASNPLAEYHVLTLRHRGAA